MDEYILTAIVKVQYVSAYATLTWQFENWKQRMSIPSSLSPSMKVVIAGMDVILTPIDNLALSPGPGHTVQLYNDIVMLQ